MQSKTRTKLPTDLGLIHFIGIGGIGMSGIAELLLNLGYKVSGSDLKNTPIISRLKDLGIPIHIGHSINNICYADIVVISSAIDLENIELCEARRRLIPVVRRSEMLAELMRLKSNIAIAGTHGKTTTSAMLSHILDQSPWKCNAFLGGIASNTNSNLLLNKESEWVVVEADEFDRSFLNLSPFASIVTAIDPDHLDIYGDASSFTDGFRQYAMKIDPNGVCIVKEGLSLPTLCPSISYGIDSDTADYNAFSLSYENNEMRFMVETKTLYL